MADFSEIMRQWKRMCDYSAKVHPDDICSFCPLAGFYCGGIYDTDANTNWNEFAEVIEKWAAEHPEPQYPTWREWLERKALVKMKPVFVNMTNTVEYVLTDEAGEQIPADIAEKLGIKPKGGAGDA